MLIRCLKVTSARGFTLFLPPPDVIVLSGSRRICKPCVLTDASAHFPLYLFFFDFFVYVQLIWSGSVGVLIFRKTLIETWLIFLSPSEMFCFLNGVVFLGYGVGWGGVNMQ